MKLLIDTTNKTIEIKENTVNLGEISDELNKLFPNGKWKEFDLVITPDTPKISKVNLEQKIIRNPSPFNPNQTQPLPYIPLAPNTNPLKLPYEITCTPNVRGTTPNVTSTIIYDLNNDKTPRSFGM